MSSGYNFNRKSDCPLLLYKGIIIARTNVEAEADEYETAMQDSGMDAQRALSKFDYFTPVVRAALHQVLAIQIYERAKGPLPDEPKLATPQERVDRIIKMSKRKVLLDFS